MYKVYKEIELDYGHRLPNHDSVCRNAHGHRGRIRVYVTGERLNESGAKEGMLIDFTELKCALESLKLIMDHRFLVGKNDTEFFDSFAKSKIHPAGSTMLGDVVVIDGFGFVQCLPFVPTAEELARLCFEVLRSRISGCVITSVKFWETPTSCAEYIP